MYINISCADVFRTIKEHICEEFGITDTTNTTDTTDNVENVVNGEDTRKRPQTMTSNM